MQDDHIVFLCMNVLFALNHLSKCWKCRAFKYVFVSQFVLFVCDLFALCFVVLFVISNSAHRMHHTGDKIVRTYVI